MSAMKNTTHSWGSIARSLHWLTALLILALLVVGFIMGEMEGQQKYQMYLMHKSFGLLALVLLVLRVIWRLADKAPAPEPAPKLQLLAASLVHWGLYAMLLAMPVSGYLAHSFRGFPLPWFGVQALPVPSLTANNPDLAHDFGELHEALVWVLLGLLALHIGAALFHHFVKKDRVLARMTPFIK